MMETKEVDYAKWAAFCIERWILKMGNLGISDTGTLINSFRSHVSHDANGDAAKIAMTFRMYGWYVDAGAGRGYKRGNGGDLGFTPKRRPRRWYNKIYWNEFRKLVHLLAEKYGHEGVMILKSIEETNYDG